MSRKFTVIATFSALALSTAPALAQTAGTTTPAQPAQDQDAQQSPGMTDQDSESMRAMMREMMQEMMGQQAPRAEGERERRVDRRGPGRWRDRDRMHRSDRMARSGMAEHQQMMRGFHGGMMRGMHGTRMRIMFAIMDADGDGALSLAEIQDFQGRIFNAVDENRDGSVAMEEIEAFFHPSGEEEDD